MFAFPALLLALLLIAIAGPSAATEVFAVGLGTAPGYARMIRGQILARQELRLRRGGDRARPLALADRPRAHPAERAPAAGRGVRAVDRAVDRLGVEPVVPRARRRAAVVGVGRAARRRPRRTSSQARWLVVIPGLVIVAVALAATTIGRHLQSLPREGRAIMSTSTGRPTDDLVDELDWPADPAAGARTCAPRFLRRRRAARRGVRRLVRPAAGRVRRHRRRVRLGQERHRALARRARRAQRDRRGRRARDPPRGRARVHARGSGGASGAATSASCCRTRSSRSTRCGRSAREIAEALRLHGWGDRAARAAAGHRAARRGSASRSRDCARGSGPTSSRAACASAR